MIEIRNKLLSRSQKYTIKMKTALTKFKVSDFKPVCINVLIDYNHFGES